MSDCRTYLVYGGFNQTVEAPMWKKDEIQGSETTPQRQAQPKAVVQGKPARTVAPGDRAAIGRSITIKGDISGDEDLYIQGSVEGSVNLKEHNVTISSEGRVKADVRARTITVQGQVEGDLFGEEQVTLSPSCRLRGNITAPRVILEDGANFRGAIDMEDKASGAPAPQRSAAEKPAVLRPSAAESGGAPNATKAAVTKS